MAQVNARVFTTRKVSYCLCVLTIAGALAIVSHTSMFGNMNMTALEGEKLQATDSSDDSPRNWTEPLSLEESSELFFSASGNSTQSTELSPPSATETTDNEKPKIDIPNISFSLNSDNVPENLRIVFLGDSLTRYQYLSLVFYLKNGRWVDPADKPNVLDAGTYRPLCKNKSCNIWPIFLNQSNAELAPYEECDCMRVSGKSYVTYSYENRYFWDPARNNSVVYIQKYGDIRSHGHWHPRDVQNKHEMVHEKADHVPYLWEYGWDEVITNHIAKLEPKPVFVVLNAGRWPHKQLQRNSVRVSIAKALNSTGLIGIYKTTTNSANKDEKLRDDPYERKMCGLLHHCLDLSWTDQTPSSGYLGDGKHFKEPMYRRMNEQMLELMNGISNNNSTASETMEA